MKDWKHVYVVYRLDEPLGSPPELDITIKSVHLAEAQAEAEVQRLTVLNADKGCRYLFQVAKMNAGEVDEREHDRHR